MRNGTVKFHSSPFGYDLYNGDLIINQREAEIVKSIFIMFLSGMGYASICVVLNENKIKKDAKNTKWFPASIQYILTNEKYIGDSLWQKNYNTSMPYRKVRNKGELEKYYINNTHEAIIIREEFEKVQELIEQRKHPNKNLINNYPLSKKIYCGKCGSLFKRRYINKKSYWVCREHYYNAENCQIKQIPEQAFYTAFTAMYNKLKANYSVIFTPMLTQLQELKNKKYGGNKQYIEINKEVVQLKEQTHVLARLKTKGFLDESKYVEQITEINARIEKLNRELRKIERCDDDDEMIEQIKEMASIIENGTDLMTGFDDVMFESLVDKIVVKNREEFEFNLVGGLKFKEKIRFLNYSYIKRIYENNIVDYEIYAKLQIKETELNSIVSNYHKRDKEFIPYGLGRMNEYCDWWDLKISDIKDSYCQLYVKRLSEDYIINSTNREIVVTNEYAGNGYLTVYLVLQ